MKFNHLKNLTGFFGFLFILTQTGFSQGYYENAIRYGYNAPHGSVKSMGMGGVQMATGADATALGTNPASPGLLRHSELQFSLIPTFTTTNTSFESGSVDASKFRAPIGSFSLALNNLKDDIVPGSFRGGTFTLSYNRVAVFDRKSSWEGTSLLSPKPGDTLKNSLIDYWMDNINKPGLYPKDILGIGSFGGAIDDVIMAYQVYLLDVNKNGEFVSIIPYGDVIKRGYWNQSLSQGLWNMGYSANFNDRLYVGASLGYFTCDFNTELQYGEEWKNVVANPNDSNFNYLQRFRGFNYKITKNLTQTYKAVTGNIGVLFKIDDAIRVSAAMQLPGIGWMNETFNSRYEANYNNIPYWYQNGSYNLNKEDTTSADSEYSWKMRLPAKYRLGASYVLGKSGMFGIDVEYTDFSQTRLSEGDGNYSFSEENAVIRKNYRNTVNIRVGGELRFEDFRFRLGYAYYPSPLQSGSNFVNNVPTDSHYLTGGLGARFETWYWDAALVLGFWSTKYTYVPEIMKVADSNIQSTQFRLGLGVFF